MVLVSGTCDRVNGLAHWSCFGIGPVIMSSQESLVQALLLQWLLGWSARESVCAGATQASEMTDSSQKQNIHKNLSFWKSCDPFPGNASVCTTIHNVELCLLYCTDSIFLLISSLNFCLLGFCVRSHPFSSFLIFSHRCQCQVNWAQHREPSIMNCLCWTDSISKSPFLHHLNLGSFPPSSLPFAKRTI